MIRLYIQEVIMAANTLFTSRFVESAVFSTYKKELPEVALFLLEKILTHSKCFPLQSLPQSSIK